MHEFNPRGIIKWSPFSALSDFQNQVSELDQALDQIEKQARTNQFWEYLDYSLSQVNVKEEVMVIFYENKQEQSISGLITGQTNKELIIDNKKIVKKDIIDIL